MLPYIIPDITPFRSSDFSSHNIELVQRFNPKGLYRALYSPNWDTLSPHCHAIALNISQLGLSGLGKVAHAQKPK